TPGMARLSPTASSRSCMTPSLDGRDGRQADAPGPPELRAGPCPPAEVPFARRRRCGILPPPEQGERMTPDDTARRMQAFAALVEARDGERSVADSRRAVAERFGLSEAEVPRVQREGASAGPLRLTVDPPLTTPVDAPGPERPAAAVGAPVAIRVRP